MASLISQFISQIDNILHKIVAQESRKLTFDETSHQAVSPSKIAYSIAHELPGRVRFHVPLISHDSFYVERLQALLKAEEWIINERINPNAVSIVITYKYRMISDSKMRSRLAHLIESAASSAVVATHSVVESTQSATSVEHSLQKMPYVHLTEETPKVTDVPETLIQPVSQELAISCLPTQSSPQETILADLSPMQQDASASTLEPSTIPVTNPVPVLDNQVFLYEVVGLHQSEETDKMNWSIRRSGSVFVRVPHNRMNQQMRWINRLGGKILSIQTEFINIP